MPNANAKNDTNVLARTLTRTHAATGRHIIFHHKNGSSRLAYLRSDLNSHFYSPFLSRSNIPGTLITPSVLHQEK